MHFCSNCGHELKTTSQFCPNCGQPLNNTPSTKAPQPPTINNKRKLWGIIAIIIVVVIAGWFWLKPNNDQGASPTNSPATKTTPTKSDTSASSTAKLPKTPWDAKKDAQLEQFMTEWAPTMGQTYQKYDGHNDIQSFGFSYPTDFAKASADEGTMVPISMGWAPTGKGNNEYNVVAIYTYDYQYKGHGPGMRIDYAFAFKQDGTPVALVNTSRQGNDTWQPTKNQDVANNFASIAKGKGIIFHK